MCFRRIGAVLFIAIFACLSMYFLSALLGYNWEFVTFLIQLIATVIVVAIIVYMMEVMIIERKSTQQSLETMNQRELCQRLEHIENVVQTMARQIDDFTELTTARKALKDNKR